MNCAFKYLIPPFLLSLTVSHGFSSEAPGQPGNAHHWTSASKVGIGTSYSADSKVWFSLVDGMLSEVYWPTIDMAQLTDMQLLVTDGESFFAEEKQDTEHKILSLDDSSLTYQQINHDPNQRFEIRKTYITDPKSHALKIQVEFESYQDGLHLYLLANPAASNTGLYDNAEVTSEALYAWDKRSPPNDNVLPSSSHVQAWVVDKGFKSVSTGFVGVNDGWQDLHQDFTLNHRYQKALDGNIALTGEIKLPPTKGLHRFEIVLGFGHSKTEAYKTATKALSKDFDKTLEEYQQQWHSYLNSLNTPLLKESSSALYKRSLMVLKAHEDKTFPGAMIASLSIPWGKSQFDYQSSDQRGILPGSPADGFKDGPVGYHVVWPRDLYQVATAFIAAGDYATAKAAVDYLKSVQFNANDGNWNVCNKVISKAGAFPQNFWLSGKPHWQGLQLDETAMPILLTWRLWKLGALRLNDYYANFVLPAADFVARVGPWTHQERWEEASGVSPSTLASAIAALVTAADMAQAQGDVNIARRYRLLADQWADAVKEWTITQQGDLSQASYFQRIEGASNCGQWLNPNDDGILDIANGGGKHLEKNVIDGGFLELVRFGILDAQDPSILSSLKVYDDTIKVDTPAGPGFYRYNHDGYGEQNNGDDYKGTGKGRLWPLLTGERGHYEIHNHQAQPYLNAMTGFANAGLMLPEQVWDQNHGPYKLGEGTGGATPLAWSHAEYIKLAQSIDQKRILDTPQVVKARYQSCNTVLHILHDVGFGNQLSVRGSGTLLNWQEGATARWTDGNIWRLSLRGLTKPIQVKTLINDSEWQSEDAFEITPCQVNVLRPSF